MKELDIVIIEAIQKNYWKKTMVSSVCDKHFLEYINGAR